MWFEKTSSGFRGWFVAVLNNGTLRAGLIAGDFTVTIVDPADSATSTPAVSESVMKPGLYYFDIPSAFFVANGIGEYGVSVEINTFIGPSGAPNVRTAFSEVLRISRLTFDEIPGEVWEELLASHTTPGTTGLAQNRIIAAETLTVIGSTATQIRTGLAQADDFFNDMVVVVVNAAGIAARNINDFTQVNGVITVDALPFVPAPGDPVYILQRTTSKSGIAGAVWDVILALHLTPGTTGEALYRATKKFIEQGKEI